MPLAFRSTAARVAVLAVLAGAAYAVPALGSSSSGVDPAAAKLVPASVKAMGTITIASDATYAPNEFIGSNGHTVVGMDADLANAIFPLLGLKINIENVTFDDIIPGLSSGKYQVGISSFTDDKAREKVVNFVDYFYAGTSFFEKTVGGPKITNLDSICGLAVSVESGTTEQTDAQNQRAKCTKQHKTADTVLSFPTQSGANLALASGHAQVAMADSPVAAYQVRLSKGQFKLVGQSYGVAPYGIAVPKSEGTLDQAILVGLKDIIKDGKYHAILAKWGLTSEADTTPKINGAIF